MEEVNLTKCKKCAEIKHRIQMGKFKNGRDKKWVDESGRQWVGHTCPSCNADRVKKAYQQKVLSGSAEKLKFGYE